MCLSISSKRKKLPFTKNVHLHYRQWKTKHTEKYKEYTEAKQVGSFGCRAKKSLLYEI
jgi:hypothetical protein